MQRTEKGGKRKEERGKRKEERGKRKCGHQYFLKATSSFNFLVK
jgi:hypothetical protein